MNIKFTPAPWAAVENGIGGFEVVKQRKVRKGLEWTPCDYDATVVMGIGDNTDPETNGNEEANAHLIAAAPAMYEMLEKARDTMLNTYDTTEWPANGLTECDVCANEIEKLLDKARGER